MTESPAIREPERREKILIWALAFYAVTTLVSMAAMSIGAVCLVLAVLWNCRSELRREWGRPDSRLYLFSALGLAGACAISLIAAKVAPLGYGGRFVEVHFLKDIAKAWYLFWPLLIAPGLRTLSPQGKQQVVRAWMVAFGILCLIGILQYFVGWPRPHMIPGNEPRYHVTAFLGHHLSFASIFLFPFFVALDLGRQSRGPETAGLPRWLLWVMAVLGLVALFGTYSRMLWLALPVGLALWALWALPRKWAVAGLVAIAVGVGGAWQVPVVKKRLLDSLGTGQRQDLWQANWEFIKLRPLTGTGWHHNLELSGYYFEDRYGKRDYFVGHAHNNLIEMLSSTGLLGAVAWITWCGVGFLLLWKRRTLPAAFTAGLVCAWVVFQLNGLTQVNFWEAKVLHQMMWVVAWSLL